LLYLISNKTLLDLGSSSFHII